MDDEHINTGQDDDRPFNGPSEWYPYICYACNCKIWIEDIIVDSFPPNGPGKCPVLYCPVCEKRFVRDIKRDSILSETDPNHWKIT